MFSFPGFANIPVRISSDWLLVHPMYFQYCEIFPGPENIDIHVHLDTIQMHMYIYVSFSDASQT